MQKSKFFGWCATRGLAGNPDISRTVRVSSQTIRNWSKKPDDAILGGHLSLTCVALDRLAEDGLDPSGIPEMTAESFKAWMIKHGFSTYEAAADAFGMTRQGVHNWFSRNSFPRWLALATLGYDLGARVAAKDSGGGA